MAKAPAAKINLWDGDVFQQHNGLRYPGAVPLETFRAVPSKGDCLAGVHQVMHRRIVSRAEMITKDNAHFPRGFVYVFDCLERADARCLRSALDGSSTTLIDVGTGVRMNAAQALSGTVSRHRPRSMAQSRGDCTLPLAGNDDQKLYTTNIQGADLNDLNAVMAVEMRKKERSGFYASRSSSSLDARRFPFMRKAGPVLFEQFDRRFRGEHGAHPGRGQGRRLPR